MGKHKGNLESRIFRAGGFVLIAHILFKLAGVIQAKAMGHYLPQTTFDVVYAFAFENCIFMLFLIGEEVLGPAFLPVFMRELDIESEKSAWSFANTVLTLQFILLVIVACALCLAPSLAVNVLTHWRPDSTPEKYALATQSVRTLAPALIGLSLGSTTYVLLNSYKRFFLAAFGDAVWKFAVVFFLVIGAMFAYDSAQVLMWGLVAGSLCKVGTHLFGLRDKLHHFRPELAFSHPAFKRFCWLALPLLAGILMAKVRDTVNSVYLLSALDQSGLMQANSMGRKLQSTLLFLIPYTLSIAAFPFFCELVDRNDHQKLGELVTRFGRMLLSVFAPFSLFVAVAAVPFTSLIFRGGHFDAVAVQRTAVSLACYTLVLPAAAIEALVMQAFFANRRMLAVTLIGILFSSFSILVSWVGLKVSGGHDLLLLAFIAGGFTLSRTFKSVALVEMLKKNAPVFPFRQTVAFLLRVGLAAGLASGLSWLLLERVPMIADLHGRTGDLIKLSVAGAAFGLVYLIAAYVLRISEIHELFTLLWKGRRRPSPS